MGEKLEKRGRVIRFDTEPTLDIERESLLDDIAFLFDLIDKPFEIRKKFFDDLKNDPPYREYVRTMIYALKIILEARRKLCLERLKEMLEGQG